MNTTLFQSGGALLATSPVYIERTADHKAHQHLQQMDYITLVEPRQQGKTSFINRLIGQTQPQGYRFACADLTTFDKSTEAAWYHSLCNWLLAQLDFVSSAELPPLPVNGDTWRNFLAALAKQAQKASYNLVMALDEVGGMPRNWATDFFSSIRSVYNSRQNIPSFRHLTFIVAGAYNPKELIADLKVSNFNVDHRIALADFNLERIGQLVTHLPAGAEAPVIAGRLHHWTNGQPYIVQRLCQYLAERQEPLTAGAVDTAVERFFQEDTNHLPRILISLKTEPALLNYARRVIKEKPKFTPSLNNWQFHLSHVIGLIAADAENSCRLRNRIYEYAFAEIEAAAAEPQPPEAAKPPEDFLYDVFISYSDKDRVWVREQLLPRLEKENFSICIDYRDFEPGLPPPVNMKNAIERSRKIILVLTPDWLTSEWAEFEARLIQKKDPVGRAHRILPLMLKPCKLPEDLPDLTYLEFTNPAEVDFQMQRLVTALRAAAG